MFICTSSICDDSMCKHRWGEIKGAVFILWADSTIGSLAQSLLRSSKEALA